jgi:1-acyl-sn-glycerol-3-phosphate acyltransferase
MTPDVEPAFASLTLFERLAVRLVRRMNRGRWQRVWFVGQREVGARWIEALSVPLLEVHGLEHVRATSRERPLLLAMNHRTFFDLYVVMSVLFRRLPGWRGISFPVRGRYFYQRAGGLIVNATMAWWAMYPPFFHEPRKRRFDQWAFSELSALCRDGAGWLIGFHPEGTRNRSPDPYSFLAPQPGIGRLMLEARPPTVPAFIAGLSSRFGEMLHRRLHGGERIRLWFGPSVDYGEFLDRPATGRNSRLVAEHVMKGIRGLAELDRLRECARQARLSGSSDPTADVPPTRY